MSENDHKELYMEYKMLTEQVRKVQQFLEQTTENIAQLGNTVEALESMSKLKKGSRFFAPIANGIFIDAQLNDPSTLRMNVGGNIVVNKNVAEAKELLEQQREELRQLRDRAQADNLKLTHRMKEIEQQIEGA